MMTTVNDNRHPHNTHKQISQAVHKVAHGKNWSAHHINEEIAYYERLAHSRPLEDIPALIYQKYGYSQGRSETWASAQNANGERVVASGAIIAQSATPNTYEIDQESARNSVSNSAEISSFLEKRGSLISTAIDNNKIAKNIYSPKIYKGLWAIAGGMGAAMGGAFFI